MNITTIIKKRRLLPVLLSFVAMGMMAVPAKRVKKTLVLADGTTVEAVLTGDENVHYYTAADGRKYVPSAVLALKIAQTFGKPVEAIFALEDND